MDKRTCIECGQESEALLCGDCEWLPEDGPEPCPEDLWCDDLADEDGRRRSQIARLLSEVE